MVRPSLSARYSRRQFLSLAGAGATPLLVPGLAVRAQPPTVKIGFLGIDRPGARLTDARAGALQGIAEARRAAELVGRRVELIHETVNPADLVPAAAGLIDQGVLAIIGDGGSAAIAALTAETERRGVALLNVGTPDDSLRTECTRTVFHVQASTSAYLDAVAEWGVREAGQRKWFFVVFDSEAGAALAERGLVSVGERGGVAAVGGTGEIGDGGVAAIANGSVGLEDALDAVERTEPDVICVMLPPNERDSFLRAFTRRSLPQRVAAVPLDAAPAEAAGVATDVWWPVLWHPGRTRYGAAQLNERFARHWDRRFTAPAWAGWMAVKIVWETVLRSGIQRPDALISALRSRRTEFDGYKGMPLTFRPSDHQLRQPIYIMDGRPGALTEAGDVPRSPDQLDQLGDPAGAVACTRESEVWAVRRARRR
jgi:ABC-type branched-subunit amino acid transport system substrate-binding protein